jgi:hypothetical protein
VSVNAAVLNAFNVQRDLTFRRDPGQARLGILSSRKLAQERSNSSPMQTNVFLTEQTLFRRKLYSFSVILFTPRAKTAANKLLYPDTYAASVTLAETLLLGLGARMSKLAIFAATSGGLRGEYCGRRNRARRTRPETRHRIANQCSPGTKQSMRSCCSAASKVVVFQWSWGALATSRSPHRFQPRVRVMLVRPYVSSMNTERAGSIRL